MNGASRKVGRAIEVVNQADRSVCPFMRPMTGDGVVLCGDWCQLRIAVGPKGSDSGCAIVQIADALWLRIATG